MSFVTRSATRLSRSVQQTTFRRNFSAGDHDVVIPGHSVKKEIVTAIALGATFGALWKNWQWSEKAKRNDIQAVYNAKLPIYVEQRKKLIEAKAAAAASEE